MSLLSFFLNILPVRSAAAEIIPCLLESSKVRGEAYVSEMWRYILTPFLQALESEPEPDILCDEMAAFAQVYVIICLACFISILFHFTLS